MVLVETARTSAAYGIDLQAPDDDAYDLVIAVASGKADHQVAVRHPAQWH